MQTKTILSWVFRIIAAGILLQTLFFKFTGSPESMYIFNQLGAEPWGRIGSGVIELIVSVLLLIPRTAWIGALGGLAVISGALLAHLTKLGIVVMDDGGKLFILALVVLVSCLVVLYLHRAPFLAFIKGIFGKR